MTHCTIAFDDGVPYAGNRPAGEVALYGPGVPATRPWRVQALVDTGADYLHLPLQAIQSVGISTRGAPRNTILTAGGTIVMLRLTVDVEIQGVRVKVPCNVANGAKPLIGRQAIFAVLRTAGFSTSEWLLEWLPSARPGGVPAGQAAPGTT